MQTSRLLGCAWLAACLAALAAPPAAAADPSVPIVVPVHGYVWGNQPSNPNYYPNTGYEYNSLGGPVQIIRQSTGRYQVVFHGMGRAGGIAHASPYGSNDRCVIVNWYPWDGDQILNVRCFGHDGSAVDTRFLANFTTRKPAGVSFGYLWNDNPTPPWYGHVPPASWSHDGAGEQIRVFRESEGHYLVYLGAFAQDVSSQWRNGFLTATVYGSVLVDCHANGSLNDSEYISVTCADLDGQWTDTRFALTYARDASTFGTSQRATTMATVIDDPVVEGWTNSAGAGAPIVTILDHDGYFQVALPHIGVPYGHAYVELMNTSPMFCNVYSWWHVGTWQYMRIRCFDPGIGEPHPVQRLNVTFMP